MGSQEKYTSYETFPFNDTKSYLSEPEMDVVGIVNL